MRKFLCLALADKVRLFLLLFAGMLLINLNAFAGRVDDVPKEGKVFYTENISGTRGESEYGDWKLTSYVVNCFDEKRAQNKEYAWLMTADGETQLAVTLNYFGNDPDYKIASQEVEFYWYDGDDIFSDDELAHGFKGLITDCDTYVGKCKQETTENSASILLTAPESFPYTNLPYYTFYVVIKVNFENGGSAAVAKNIGISRPGVLLLHGLWSSRDAFVSFSNYLIYSEVYIPVQVYCGDYNESHAASFFENTYVTRVVSKCLKDISNNLFSVGIASTKYDMIGHSMGGILERMYNQEVDNKHTNKLITLNTPHFGSCLGKPGATLTTTVYALKNSLKEYNKDVFSTIFTILDAQNKNGALWDLSLNSYAIQNLNSSVKSLNLKNIPICAVGSRINMDFINTPIKKVSQGISVGISKTISKVMDLDDTESFLLAYLTTKEMEKLVGEAGIGDGVVSVDSQRGGLSSNHSHIYSGSVFDANHCGAPKWYVIHDKLLQLLTTTSRDEFSLTGFGTTPTANKSRTGSRENDTSTEFITDFEQPRDSSFIRINIERVNNEEYTHKIKLDYSDDLERIIAFAKLSDNEVILDYGKDEMYFDMSGYDHEVTIYAIGRTDYNAFVADSIKVKLGESTDIADVYTSNIHYSMNGKDLVIHNQDEPYVITVCDMLGRTLICQKNNPSHTYTLPDRNSVLIVRIKTKDDVQALKILPSAEKSQKQFNNLKYQVK